SKWNGIGWFPECFFGPDRYEARFWLRSPACHSTEMACVGRPLDARKLLRKRVIALYGVAIRCSSSASQPTMVASIIKGGEMPRSLPISKLGIGLDHGPFVGEMEVQKLKDPLVAELSQGSPLPCHALN